MSNSNLIDSGVISELQNYLINIRSIHPSLPAIYPTGVYDENTRHAVRAFQNITKLPSTGIVDFVTWNSLVKENTQYIKRIEFPGRVPVSSHDFIDIHLGDEKDIVYAIRIMLNHFHRRYVNYNELEITNLYNEEVEKSVRLFQERSMLPVTGIVDKDTWNYLVTIYETCGFYR